MKKQKQENWIKVGKVVDGKIVPPQPPEPEEFSIDLSPEDEDLLFSLAEQHGQTFNQFIETVLKKYLENIKAK